MNTAVKLPAFLGGVALVFGTAFAAGTVTASSDAEPAAKPARHEQEGMQGSDTSAEHGDRSMAVPSGLAVSERGYTLRPQATSLPMGGQVPFGFTVTGPDGQPVHEYRTTHEKELHLIVVRRDLASYEHVHPTRAADGTWSVPLNLPAAGTYRLYADIAPAGLGGQSITLGADVFVAGQFTPVALPAPVSTVALDGYDVALAGTPRAGVESELTFTVSRGGAPVRDLQPYLGAFGHLVSLRGGDLAYLHTHPGEQAKAGQAGGPQVRFATTFPTPGSHRLFLDFQHAGKVRTAAFTVEVPAPGTGGEKIPSPTASGSSHGPHGH